MDRAWIKFVLLAAFVVSLIFVFVYGFQALRPPKAAQFDPPPVPKAPDLPPLQPVTDLSKPEVAKLQIDQLKAQADAYQQAVSAYQQSVTAYTKDVEARTTAWKAATGDPAARLTAYEKVVKDTLGALIVTPLLAALVLYSGLKMGADAAVARAAAAANAPQANVPVKAP